MSSAAPPTIADIQGVINTALSSIVAHRDGRDATEKAVLAEIRHHLSSAAGSTQKLIEYRGKRRDNFGFA